MKNILVFAFMMSIIALTFGEGGATAYSKGSVVIFAQGQAYSSGNQVAFAQGQTAYTTGNDVHFAQGEAYTSGNHVSFAQAQAYTKGSDIYFGQGKMSEAIVVEFIEATNNSGVAYEIPSQAKGMALVQIKNSTETAWGVAYETVVVGQEVTLAQ